MHIEIASDKIVRQTGDVFIMKRIFVSSWLWRHRLFGSYVPRVRLWDGSSIFFSRLLYSILSISVSPHCALLGLLWFCFVLITGGDIFRCLVSVGWLVVIPHKLGTISWSGISSKTNSTTGRPFVCGCTMIPLVLWEVGGRERDLVGLKVLGAKLKAEEDDSNESKDPKRSLVGIPWSSIDSP